MAREFRLKLQGGKIDQWDNDVTKAVATEGEEVTDQANESL